MRSIEIYTNEKKVGFFGGTFNPVHIGHIRMALEVYEEIGLSHIHFVPAPIPPHKKVKALLDFQTRVDFLNNSFKEYNLDSYFSVSEHENSMQGPSYSFYSVQLWQELYGQTPYFIVGLEDFLQLENWHNGLEIPRYSNFIVVKRAHYKREDFHTAVERFWLKKDKYSDYAQKINDASYSIFGNSIEYLETSRLDISSTQIRNAMIEGKNASLLLPENVRKYVLAHDEIITKWSE